MCIVSRHYVYFRYVKWWGYIHNGRFSAVLSHFQILEVPSKLFYSNSLVAKASLPPNGPQDIPPVGFVGVDGQEKRDEDSPSFLNLLEAEKVAAKVRVYFVYSD